MGVIHTMASRMNTKDFFGKGTPNQYDFTLTQYDQALRLKAESKSSKPENVIKLDKWYQNELPKKIKSRGKDAHLVHDELVQTIKWKLARGKFRPNLVNLVQMNTPRVVMQETKKAFRKLQKTNDLQSAIQSLCNVKGVGPAMASAVMAAGAPHAAPFMADECLLAMPEIDSLDYTMKEYMRYVDYVKVCVDRLNSQEFPGITLGEEAWTPHKVELAVWTHFILRDLKPETLDNMPAAEAPKPKPVTPVKPAEEPSGTEEPSKIAAESAPDFVANGDEDTKSSMDSEAADQQPPVTEQQELTEAENHTQEVSLPEVPKPSAAAAVIEEEVTQTPAPVALAEATQTSAPVAPAEVTEPPPSAPVAEANGSEKSEVISATTQETPKTNGNNSHSSNGSSQKNGDDHPQQQAEAKKVENLEQASNGELENGVNSSEKESTTDLKNLSPPTAAAVQPTKRPIEAAGDVATFEDNTTEPSAKKLKSCVEGAEVPASAPSGPPQPPPGPPEEAPHQVAV